MKISEVKVFPVNEEKLKAYVTIVLDNCFVIRDLKVISGNTGLFVAMPSKKRKDGTYRDIAHPLNQGTRAELEEVILQHYQVCADGADHHTGDDHEHDRHQSDRGIESKEPTLA